MKPDIKYVSPAEAFRGIQSNDRIFVQGSACTPVYLLQELAKEADRLKNVEVVSITLQGDIEINKPEYQDSFHINSLFTSEPSRKAIAEGRADFVPVFLSDIPDLFLKGIMPVRAALVMVSPPDKHGYCTLGVSVDVARAACLSADIIIGQVNPKVPRTHGDGSIHASRFTHLVYHDMDLPEVNYGAKVTDIEMQIGRYVAELIDDGSTLQMGIGTIPDAVFRCLNNHKHLGVHTEMCSDGIIDLFDRDVIDNTRKKFTPTKPLPALPLAPAGCTTMWMIMMPLHFWILIM